jgi:hypothetical protein
MMRGIVLAIFGVLLTSFVAGCGNSGGVELAPAGGTLTSGGKPVIGANITFIPQSGPVAVGISDDQGKFNLATGGELGAPLGLCRVSVIHIAPSDDVANVPAEERTKELTKMMGQAKGRFGEKDKKSLVPEKYSKAETSGLSFTVSPNGSENDFKIDLVP